MSISSKRVYVDEEIEELPTPRRAENEKLIDLRDKVRLTWLDSESYVTRDTQENMEVSYTRVFNYREPAEPGKHIEA